MPDLAPNYSMGARLLAAANHIAHSDLDAQNSLCEEAAFLLPQGADAAVLAEAVARSLSSGGVDSLATLV
jgi:hypothetical protein